MIIDVFGRHSKRVRASGRDPPGIGFKIKPEEHYDMDNKRLLNVAEAKEQKDAVNLNLLQRLVQQEIQTVYTVTSSMRTNIDNNNAMIQILNSNISEKLQNLQADAETIQELVYRNSELITQLDVKLNALENGRREAAVDEGAT